MHLAGSGAALQEDAEPVACPLVVLQPLAQAPVVILYEAPVQDDLELACRERVPAWALAGISHAPSWGAPEAAGPGLPVPSWQHPPPQHPLPPRHSRAAPKAQPHGPLTTAETGDAQGLGCVQCQAALRVLDVGHGGHGVEVGLERQLPLVPAGLDLPRSRAQCLEVALAMPGARAPSPCGQRPTLPGLPHTWKPLRSVKKVSSLSMSVLKRRASSMLIWSRMSTRQDTSRDSPSTPGDRQ